VNFLLHWLAVHTGTVNESGPYYGFWSGFGGDLAIIGALLWGPVVLLRKHNCEVHRCFRLARHSTAAGHHVCRRHHPDGHLTAQKVGEHHRRAVMLRHHSAAGERLYNHDRDGPESKGGPR
jgi:hypothetical protein